MSNGSKGKAMRREERFPIALSAHFNNGRKVVPGEIVDVSYKGFFLAIGDPPEKRKFVRTTIELPEDFGSIQLAGMVAHQEPGDEESGKHQGAGIQLFGNGDDVLSVWSSFIKSLLIKSKIDGDTTELAVIKSSEQALSVLNVEYDIKKLLHVYLLDIPQGYLFVPTNNNLAINDWVDIQIIKLGKKDGSFFTLNGKVVSHNREPANFGVNVSLMNITNEVIYDLWQFIVS